MIFYCCHKFGGLESNKMDCEELIKELQLNDTENIYISPIHSLGYMYNDISYDEGMKLCLMLLSICDEVLVLSDISEGVRLEIEYAKKLQKPIRYKD